MTRKESRKRGGSRHGTVKIYYLNHWSRGNWEQLELEGKKERRVKKTGCIRRKLS